MLYKNIWDLSIALWENICFQNRNNKCLTYKIEWDILYPTKGNQMTIETIKKEWEDLEDIDLAEFVLKAYLEGNICGTSRTLHQRQCVLREWFSVHIINQSNERLFRGTL